MANYSIQPGAWGGLFVVPVELVDRHLRLASPNALKIFLYLLRYGKAEVSLEELEKALGVPQAEAAEAVEYWVANGLLTPQEGGAAPVKRAVAPSPARSDNAGNPPSAQTPPPVQTAEKTGLSRAPSYTNADIADAVAKHAELKFLFARAEEMFGRPLSNVEVSRLYQLFEWYGLPVDVITMIMERCAKADKLSMHRVAREAESWYQHGVRSLEDADRYILELDARDSMYGQVMRTFGIHDRALSAGEKKHIDRWRTEFHFGIEMVRCAYEICVDKTAKLSFPYINTILKSWHEHGIDTPEAAAQEAQAFRAASAPGQKAGKPRAGEQAASYDLNEEVARAFRQFSPESGGQE